MDMISWHGGNIWHFNKKRIIDFSANINPLGLSENLKKYLSNNLDTLVHYPEPYAQRLRNDFARFLKINPENILFGNGSIELIHSLPRILSLKKIAIPIPSFSEYEYASRNTKTKYIFIKSKKKDNLQINIHNLIKYFPKIDFLFLGHPNNPTGQVFYKPELRYLVKEAEKHKVYLIIDEVFIDFIKDSDSLSLIKEAVDKKYLIILRSLTKFFAIAGLRLGYLVSNERLVNKMIRFQYPWSVNTLAQLSARRFIYDKNYIKQTLLFINREKEFLFKSLKKISCLNPFYPNANFVLCKLEHKKYNSTKLACVLFKRGVLIRDCSNFRGLNDKYFRIAVRKRDENLKLISCLKEIL